MSERTFWFFVGCVIVVSMLWYPHSLFRTMSLGYDFPIYYTKALYGEDRGWVYAEWIKWVFVPFTWVPYYQAHVIFYSLSLAAFLRITSKLASLRGGWILCVLSLYPYVLSQELCNVTIILAWACFSPVGALLAGAVKPFLFIFVLVHAFTGGYEPKRMAGLAKAKLDLLARAFIRVFARLTDDAPGYFK